MSGEDPAPGDNGASDSRPREGLIARLRALFGARTQPNVITEAIENGVSEAVEILPSARREMIERVVAFDEKKVVDVMAPRADIFAVDIDTPLDDLIRIFAEAGHSRLPIYRGGLDDPVGMVHIKDVVGLVANGEPQAREPGLSHDKAGSTAPTGSVLKKIRREILYVPPSMHVTDLLLRMQASRIHMALVIDEYGGTDGLVTIEDLVEEIVGDINDEHDKDEAPAIAPLAGGGWDADARVELDEFAEETGVRLMAEDDEIDTIGGYVVSLAGRVPQRGEVIAGFDGLDFEIAEADARKVRRVRIRPAAVNSSEAAE